VLAGFLDHTDGKITITSKKTISRNNLKSFIDTGVIEEINPFYRELSVHDNIEYFVRSSGKKSAKKIVSRIIKTWKLNSIAHQKIKNISALDGAIISFAVSLINNPDIILLDEPTKSLTNKQSKNFWKTIHPFLKDKTLIFTTLKEDEAKKYSNSIFMMEKAL